MSTDTITKPIEITLEAYVEATRKAVEEKGADYVYPRIPLSEEAKREAGYDEDEDDLYETCTYVRDGAPSCLVGHALHILGVPLDALAEQDARAGGANAYTTIRELTQRGLILPEKKVDDYAYYSQAQQDGGEPWGKAVAYADYTVLGKGVGV